MPINLDLSQEEIAAKNIVPGARVVLRDPRDDEALAIITGTYRSPLWTLLHANHEPT